MQFWSNFNSNLRGMAKILTLRNIMTLSVMLFFTACTHNNVGYSSSGELKSISSEDKSISVSPLAELTDPESGQTIYFVAKQ